MKELIEIHERLTKLEQRVALMTLDNLIYAIDARNAAAKRKETYQRLIAKDITP